MKLWGTLKDGREVYIDENNTLWARNEIPTTLMGPTPTEIEQFEKEHQDAKPCPKCGYKFYVSPDFIDIAYEDGFCRVCEVQSSARKVKE